jgi:hypothetical protein
VLLGFVALIATAARTTESSAGLAWTLEEAILKIIEGAHTRDIFWIEATDDGIEGFIVHHLDPDIKAGDTTFHHGKTGAKHAHGVASRSALAAGVEHAQEGVCQIEVGLSQLLPDGEMAMVGTQAAAAAGSVAHKTNVLVMRKGSW